MFDDIKHSSNWEAVTKVQKGWSSDNKYLIKTKEGSKLLFRISDVEQYDAKKKEYEIITKYSKLGFNMSLPVDFGICNSGKMYICMVTFIREILSIQMMVQLA